VVVSTAFLAEFLSGGRAPALTRLTAEPTVEPLAVPGVEADLYRGAECAGPWPGRACSLVLVHGLAPEGKNDPRLRRAARLLARAGFAVAVPTVRGLTRLRLDEADVATVAATIGAMPAPVRVVGVSVGAGPALLAATDDRIRDRVAVVLTLGGYASARELARFYVTARPEQARDFAAANPDWMDASAREALATGRLDDLSPDLQRRLDALSPELAVGRLRARLLIVHGRDDPAVPFSESLRLAAAAREKAHRVVIIGGITHVEGGALRRGGDLGQLWTVTRELLAGGV
jgi:pimeloyl-ACP methyl ester carboxylesterase